MRLRVTPKCKCKVYRRRREKCSPSGDSAPNRGLRFAPLFADADTQLYTDDLLSVYYKRRGMCELAHTSLSASLPSPRLPSLIGAAPLCSTGDVEWNPEYA